MKERVKIEKVTTLSKRFIDLRLYDIRYTRYDGRSEILEREVHDHGHAAAVLPYDATRGTILLVKQFRLPPFLSGESGEMIEACAGLLGNDAPESCARREAEEELGYRIENLRQVASAFMTPGAVTERVTMFLADYRPESKVNEGGGHAAEGEDVEVLELPLADAQAMAKDGRIIDAKTIMLLMYLERELYSLS